MNASRSLRSRRNDLPAPDFLTTFAIPAGITATLLLNFTLNGALIGDTAKITAAPPVVVQVASRAPIFGTFAGILGVLGLAWCPLQQVRALPPLFLLPHPPPHPN